MNTVILFLTFVSMFIFAGFGVPMIFKIIMTVNKRRAKDFEKEAARAMIAEDIEKVKTFYILGPFLLAGCGFVLIPAEFRLIGVIAGGIFGFIIPRTYAGILQAKHREQFNNQLSDALLIMSSSFRGGLSLIQAIETVVEEMGNPIKQEFGFLVSENKMGVPLEEALNRLYDKLPSPAFQQMVTAILLSRETGGNLPVVFSRIVETLRERRKIEENMKVLTVQGKIQAVVMSGLPVVFFIMVNQSNPKYFEVMFASDLGRSLLIVASVLWVIGTFLIIKISAIKDF